MLRKLLSLSLFATAACWAQSTGAVLGTVSDSAGATIPSAQAIVRNELTGLEWTASTDESGRFNFPRLPVGEYRVRVTKQGFQQFVSEMFRLDADQNRSITVSLTIGSMTESVTVTGSVSQVETVSGTIREVVDQRRIAELPLNGRNAVQLVQLVPGAVNAPGTSNLSANSAIAVNGTRGTATNYLLDGGDNNDPQENVSAVTPNPDALEEFSVLTNNFSAEYGRNAGAVVNAVTKSGTNALHGSLFEFLRNDAVDARNFFALNRGKLRRNQYGGSVGGPAIKNKLFYFGSFEGVKQRQGATTSTLVVPTDLERRGDFSASAQRPRDPDTNQPFANGVIPATRFDPASLKFMELLQVPSPNAAGSRFIYNQPQNLNTTQYLARADYSLSSAQRLSARLFETSSTEMLTAGLPVLQSDVKFDTWNITGTHTWTISPSMVGVGMFTWNKSQIDRGPLPVGGGDGVSYQAMGVRANRGGLDALGKTLTPHFRGQVNGFWNLNQDNLVLIDRGTNQAAYAINWTRGSHLIKFGGEYRTTKSDRVTANGIDPQFTFNGQITGNSFGDFLIGRALNFTQGSVRINRIRSQTFNLYAEDQWKVNRDLSLTFGLRYEPFLPYYSADDEITLFRPGQQSTAFPSAPNGLVYYGDPGVPRGGTESDWNNFAPRVSFAWSPFGNKKTSIRGAYGVFYDILKFHQVSHFVNSPPYSLQITVNAPRSFSDPYAGQANPFPYAPPTSAQDRAAYRFLLPATVGLSVNPEVTAPYVQQWNFNVQRELVSNLIMTAAYIGTKGTKLPIRNELNPAIYRAGATTANINARRIYVPNYQSIVDYQTVINSTYHSLQLTMNKRFSRGFTLLAGYTWSKAIDGSSLEVDGFNGQNPLDLRAEKGLANFDVRHRLVTSFLYELPGPKSGIARWIIGGWQANGIFIAQSGTTFTVTSGQDRALSGVASQRPDLVGNPLLDTSRSRDELLAMYFNPAAYALPAIGSFGNVGRNTMIGPGRWNLDSGLFKTFPVREKLNVTFRWEMFNAFNHANLNNPRSNISVANPGRIDSTSDARVMQLGLRIVF